jgi:hypothetical protein
MSRWYNAAAALIGRIDATLPKDADLATRRRALRGKGWPAHEGTYWGRRMWGRAVRDYLRLHGARQNPKPIPANEVDRRLFGGPMDFPAHPDSVRGARP